MRFCQKVRAIPGIEPGTSRTRNENPTTRPNSRVTSPSNSLHDLSLKLFKLRDSSRYIIY